MKGYRISIPSIVILILLFLSSNIIYSQTSIFTNQLPASSGSDGDYELGLKFHSTSTAQISAIRFYKIAGETGTHNATLWSNSGTVIATAEFTGESASGWQYAELSSPILIAPNTTYVVSVNLNTLYGIEEHQLDNPITNDFLTAEAGGGVFNETIGQFPANSYNNSNYFVDVVASPLNSIFTTQLPVSEYNDGPYEMGVKFTTSQTAKVKMFSYYKMAGETGTHIGHLWTNTGTLLASATFTNETSTGWQYAALNTDVYIQPGDTYVVSVNSNSTYAAGAAQSLGTSVTNGILSTVADNNNGVYSGSPNTQGVFPTVSFNNNNYFRDILVEPVTQPNIPAHISPSNNAENVSIEPTISWSEINGATYTLQVATDASFSNLIVNVSGLTGTTFNLTGLTNNTNYFWRVSAEKESLTSGFSSAYKFTTILYTQVVLSWPINGASLASAPISFSWYLPMGGTGWKFDLLYSTDINMASPTVLSNVNSNPYSISGLEPGTLYYWKIRLKTSDGAVVSYSDKESFVTFGKALIPIPSAPNNEETIYTLSPTLYWYLNDASTGLTYDLEFIQGAPGTLTGTPTETDITNTNFQLTNLEAGKQYSWRVRSKSGSNYSDWSNSNTFYTVATEGPKIPLPSWPIGGATIYTTSPTLNWYLNSASSGLSYQVELVEGSLSAFTGIPNITNINSFSIALNNLVPGKVYKWRVRSSDGLSFSDWSEIAEFSIFSALGNSPVNPVPSWPVGGATVYANSTKLNWYLGASVSGLTYEVEMRAGALNGTPTITGINSLNTTVNNLTPSTTYYWHVRSTNGSTTSDWSATESFTTIAANITAAVPHLSWPIGGATVYTTSPHLSWYLNSSSVGITYELEYSINSNMSGAITIPGLNSAQTDLTSLTPGTIYYWRVRSFDGTVYSSYSAIESFVIYSGPYCVIPIAASPVDGISISSASAVLSWYLPTQGNISDYEVQYSINSNMDDPITIETSSTSQSIENLQPGKTYYWRVRSLNSKGETSNYSSIQNFVPANITSVDNQNQIPTSFELKQNYPNPFNPTTILEFSIPEAGNYSLDIFNILGQRVSNLVNSNLKAGVYKYIFNGLKLSSGVYFYKLSGQNVNLIRKMLLLK